MVKTNHDDMGGGILLFGIQSDYALRPFNYYERVDRWFRKFLILYLMKMSLRR